MTDASGLVARAGGRVGVLLVHGLGDTPADLAPIADRLVGDGHTVVCPLLAGHGATPAEFDASRWTEWYVSAELALDRLADTCDVIVVGGVSAGALLALRLAAEEPDLVQGCMLFAPALGPAGWAMPWSLRALALIAHRRIVDLFTVAGRPPFGIKDELIRAREAARRVAGGRSFDTAFGRRGGTLLEHRRLVADVVPRLAEIMQPVQVFQPRDDDQGDLSTLSLLQRQLGGRVEAMVLQDSYHSVLVDRQRDLVIARACRFVADVARDQDATRANPFLRAPTSRNG